MVKIDIIYGSSSLFIFPVSVSAASIARSVNSETHLVFHLLDMGLGEEDWDSFCNLVRKINSNCAFIRHTIPADTFSGFEAYHGSMAPYLRMLAPELLADVDWAVYIDGDTICVGDIAKLWLERDESKLIVGSIDPPPPIDLPVPEDDWFKAKGLAISREEYFCTGLMLLNLRKMREMDITSKCRKFLELYGTPPLIDQTTLNYVCKGFIGHLSREWGLFSMLHEDYDLRKDAIIHYVHDLPWKRAGACQLMTDVVLLWYDFCEHVLGTNLKYKYYGKISFALRRLGYKLLCLVPWIKNLHPYLKSHIRDVVPINSETKDAILAHWRVV